MTSLRHNLIAEPVHPAAENAAAPPAGAGLRDGYLDAARACILDVGWRRTTLTEVARRAGVSRMTIYRTWGDMPRLLSDLMTREWAGVVAASVSPAAADDTVRDHLVADLVATVGNLRANELFGRILELDPELLLPYLFERRGRSQDAILALVESRVRAGQDAGTIRAGNPTVLTRSLLLAAQGFVLSAATMTGDGVDLDALDAELTTLLTRALLP